MLVETQCPVCNSKNIRKLFNLNSEEAGKLIIPNNRVQAKEISTEIAQLWQNDECEFLSCNNCEYSFSRPYIAGNEKIYSLLYYKAFDYPKEKWEYTKAINILKNLNLTSDSTLLEVGAGNGAFLSKISPIILNNRNIYSTEYSQAGIETIQQKGFNCICADITELPKNALLPKFNVICMFQVLEHMNELSQVFKSINLISNDLTKLIIAVPNGYLRNFYDSIGLHYDIPPIHVGRFTEKTFHSIADQYGWKVVADYIEPQRYILKLKKFIFDRYARNRFSEKTEKLKSSSLKYLFRYSILFSLLFRYIKVVLKLTSPKTGTSLLVYLEKQSIN